MGDGGPVVWVVDTDAQAVKIPLAQGAHDISQAIVTGMAAACFKARLPWGQVQFVMNDQDLVGIDTEIVGQTGDRLAAAVHISGWFQEADFFAVQVQFANRAVMAGFNSEWLMMLLGKFVDKPKSGIVTGLLVIGAWISEAHDEPDGCG